MLSLGLRNRNEAPLREVGKVLESTYFGVSARWSAQIITIRLKKKCQLNWVDESNYTRWCRLKVQTLDAWCGNLKILDCMTSPLGGQMGETTAPSSTATQEECALKETQWGAAKDEGGKWEAWGMPKAKFRKCFKEEGEAYQERLWVCQVTYAIKILSTLPCPYSP